MRAGLNLTEKEKALIILLRNEGHSHMAIATIMGRNKSTVKRVIREASKTIQGE